MFIRACGWRRSWRYPRLRARREAAFHGVSGGPSLCHKPPSRAYATAIAAVIVARSCSAAGAYEVVGPIANLLDECTFTPLSRLVGVNHDSASNFITPIALSPSMINVNAGTIVQCCLTFSSNHNKLLSVIMSTARHVIRRGCTPIYYFHSKARPHSSSLPPSLLIDNSFIYDFCLLRESSTS